MVATITPPTREEWEMTPSMFLTTATTVSFFLHFIKLPTAAERILVQTLLNRHKKAYK